MSMESLGTLLRQRGTELVAYWPEETLPTEARNWCRILVGTTKTGVNQEEVTLWQVGEYNIYSRKV